MPKPLLIALVILIGSAWTANLVVDYTTGRGEPAVNAIFGIVVGSLFALGRKDKPTGGRGDRKPGRRPVDELRSGLAGLIEPDDDPDTRGDHR